MYNPILLGKKACIFALLNEQISVCVMVKDWPASGFFY